MNYAQTYLMANMGSFPAEQLPAIQRELEQMDEQAAARALMMTDVKNPTTALLFALFLGEFGADRFYIGNKELGFGKLALFIVSFVTLFIVIGFILFPILYIWKIIDCFLIMGACRQANFERLVLNLNIQKSQTNAAKATEISITSASAAPAEETVVDETAQVLQTQETALAAQEVFETAETETVELTEDLADTPVAEVDIEDLVSQETQETAIPVEEPIEAEGQEDSLALEDMAESQESLEVEQKEITVEEAFGSTDAEMLEVTQSIAEKVETEVDMEELVSQEEVEHSIPVEESLEEKI